MPTDRGSTGYSNISAKVKLATCLCRKATKRFATHSAEGKSLLPFRKSREGLIFEDEMVYETHRIERAPDSHGNERDAIVFELRSLSAIVGIVEAAEGCVLRETLQNV